MQTARSTESSSLRSNTRSSDGHPLPAPISAKSRRWSAMSLLAGLVSLAAPLGCEQEGGPGVVGSTTAIPFELERPATEDLPRHPKFDGKDLAKTMYWVWSYQIPLEEAQWSGNQLRYDRARQNLDEACRGVSESDMDWVVPAVYVSDHAVFVEGICHLSFPFYDLLISTNSNIYSHWADNGSIPIELPIGRVISKADAEALNAGDPVRIRGRVRGARVGRLGDVLPRGTVSDSTTVFLDVEIASAGALK